MAAMANLKLTDLGRRERQIMDSIYRRGRATVADVLEDLADPPSYSAVRGMLAFLEQKGHVRHEQDGPRYVYLPTSDPEQIKRKALKHVLHTFFNNSMESAVATLLDVSDKPLSDETAKRIALMIEKAYRKGARK
jgi:BlaI family penicillinase repressor